ncbi:hypothetical protein IAT38_000332 [Cryptococcus sp. DSM 104549]
MAPPSLSTALAIATDPPLVAAPTLLPPNIRHHIIAHLAALDRHSLLTIVRTCRAWHDAYLPLVYQHVVLRGRENANKFLYGWGGPRGPTDDDAVRWLTTAKVESPEATEAASGMKVGIRSSYWRQPPCEQLQARMNLVRQLDILDGPTYVPLALESGRRCVNQL